MLFATAVLKAILVRRKRRAELGDIRDARATRDTLTDNIEHQPRHQ